VSKSHREPVPAGEPSARPSSFSLRRWASLARNFVDLEKTYLEAAMRGAASFASGNLLDVGCGDKPYESIFSPYVVRYVGAEYDETYTGSANARKGKADVVYAGDRLPFGDGEFDTVLSNQVAEHVPNPRMFFAELARVLRVGGSLIVTVPFSYRVHSEPYDFHRFTKYALARYAEDHGLVVKLLQPRGGFWSVVGQKLMSHMALKYARLGGEVQKLGGFGYENTIQQRPRYWTLPVIAPLLLAVAVLVRLLDRIDPDESDTIGYLLVAEKLR
jgi:SAM-dependent methyltransferase